MPDEDYAQLSLAMRTGDDPATVFDALLARDQIRIHASDAERVSRARPARRPRPPWTGIAAVVVADTNEQVTALNDAIRAELVASGRVDDTHTTTGHEQHASVPVTGSSPAATTPTWRSPTATPGPSPACTATGR